MTANGAPANGGNQHAAAIAERRNLVLFMPDQLRYDSLACTGNPVIRTPNFDALAKEGTLFTSASVSVERDPPHRG